MTVGSLDLLMVSLSPELSSFLLVMWRDAPLSTINCRSSCPQSDRDATTFDFSCLVGRSEDFSHASK